MARPVLPLDDTLGGEIYELLKVKVIENQVTPNAHAIWKHWVLPQYPSLSIGGFRYWMERLEAEGLLEFDPVGGGVIMHELTIKVTIPSRESIERLLADNKPKKSSIRRRAKVRTGDNVRFMYKAQKGLCWWCGEDLLGVYRVDHRFPWSKGGPDDLSNLCLACPSCNSQKGAKVHFNGRLL